MWQLKSKSQELRKWKRSMVKYYHLGKSDLNSIEVLISKVLIDSNITHDKLVLINNVPKEFDNMKEKLQWKIKV